MNIDPGLIQFEHCQYFIFCRKLPDTCPICRQKLENTIVPIRVSFPFIRGNQYPCSVLIKPSNGNFLHDYSPQYNDLHIGVTSSEGTVVEYDIHGISLSNTQTWDECILIYKLDDLSWQSHWDEILMKTSEKFTSLRYDEHESNCYSFVLKFMQSLQYNDNRLFVKSKEIYCEKMVIPKLKNAYKYLLLFRRTENNNYYIKPMRVNELL